MTSLSINSVPLAHSLGAFVVSIYRLDPALQAGSPPLCNLFLLQPLVSPSPTASSLPAFLVASSMLSHSSKYKALLGIASALCASLYLSNFISHLNWKTVYLQLNSPYPSENWLPLHTSLLIGSPFPKSEDLKISELPVSIFSYLYFLTHVQSVMKSYFSSAQNLLNLTPCYCFYPYYHHYNLGI